MKTLIDVNKFVVYLLNHRPSLRLLVLLGLQFLLLHLYAASVMRTDPQIFRAMFLKNEVRLSKFVRFFIAKCQDSKAKVM